MFEWNTRPRYCVTWMVFFPTTWEKGGERVPFSPSPEKTERLTHVKTVFCAALPLKYAAKAIEPTAGYQNHRHLYSTDHIAQFIGVAVTCNWKTEIPLAFVNSFPSVLVTWLQKAVKARLKIKYIIKDLINLRCIEDSIVVLIYVLKFPLKEKRHQRYKHLLVK